MVACLSAGDFAARVGFADSAYGPRSEAPRRRDPSAPVAAPPCLGPSIPSGGSPPALCSGDEPPTQFDGFHALRVVSSPTQGRPWRAITGASLWPRGRTEARAVARASCFSGLTLVVLRDILFSLNVPYIGPFRPTPPRPSSPGRLPLASLLYRFRLLFYINGKMTFPMLRHVSTFLRSEALPGPLAKCPVYRTKGASDSEAPLSYHRCAVLSILFDFFRAAPFRRCRNWSAIA